MWVPTIKEMRDPVTDEWRLVLRRVTGEIKPATPVGIVMGSYHTETYYPERPASVDDLRAIVLQLDEQDAAIILEAAKR